MTGEYTFVAPAGETKRVDPYGSKTRPDSIVGGHSSNWGSFLSIMVGRQKAMLKILAEQH
jgi:hypothetical protein